MSCFCTAGDLVAGVLTQLRSPAARPPVVQIVLGLLLCAGLASAQTLQEAENLHRNHDDKSAGHVFEQLLKADPKNATYRVRYADLLYQDFNVSDADKLYQEALQLDPKNARAYLGEARILADEFNPKANELLAKALEYDPKLYEAHELMARAALEDDDTKKADAEADAALAIQADAVDAIAVKASIDLLADKQSPWVAKIGNSGQGLRDHRALLHDQSPV